MSPGARLAFDSGTGFAIGRLGGSIGRVNADNAIIDARGAEVALGQGTGSNGTMSLATVDAAGQEQFHDARRRSDDGVPLRHRDDRFDQQNGRWGR